MGVSMNIQIKGCNLLITVDQKIYKRGMAYLVGIHRKLGSPIIRVIGTHWRKKAFSMAWLWHFTARCLKVMVIRR